ncbi:MAG: XRE family transcriptional regulator [Caulobacteraceae bacterium]|nr:XRE family transcriptional regulator [Caulobacteraceae bacterium]
MSAAEVFGRNVRRLRQRSGLSLEALATDIGVSYSYLGEIERGQRNPTLRIVDQVALALGTTPAKLLEP